MLNDYLIELCVFFKDAIREMRKYSNEEYDLTVNPKAEMQGTAH
jgi:hypothetical protein